MSIVNPLNKLPYDKALHMIGGVLILLAALLLGLGSVVGMAIVLIAAVGKELYDKLHPKNHTADVWDAVATVSLAGLIALVFYLTQKGVLHGI